VQCREFCVHDDDAVVADHDEDVAALTLGAPSGSRAGRQHDTLGAETEAGRRRPREAVADATAGDRGVRLLCGAAGAMLTFDCGGRSITQKNA
jgi:hypothetical protein